MWMPFAKLSIFDICSICDSVAPSFPIFNYEVCIAVWVACVGLCRKQFGCKNDALRISQQLNWSVSFRWVTSQPPFERCFKQIFSLPTNPSWPTNWNQCNLHSTKLKKHKQSRRLTSEEQIQHNWSFSWLWHTLCATQAFHRNLILISKGQKWLRCPIKKGITSVVRISRVSINLGFQRARTWIQDLVRFGGISAFLHPFGCNSIK